MKKDRTKPLKPPGRLCLWVGVSVPLTPASSSRGLIILCSTGARLRGTLCGACSCTAHSVSASCTAVTHTPRQAECHAHTTTGSWAQLGPERMWVPSCHALGLTSAFGGQASRSHPCSAGGSVAAARRRRPPATAPTATDPCVQSLQPPVSCGGMCYRVCQQPGRQATTSHCCSDSRGALASGARRHPPGGRAPQPGASQSIGPRSVVAQTSAMVTSTSTPAVGQWCPARRVSAPPAHPLHLKRRP